MAKKNKLQTKWIILLGTWVILLAGFSLWKNNIIELEQQETGYQMYQNPTFDFSIEYPKAWEIREGTQVFENGDAVAFGKTGSTQKKQTEITDGAQVVVSKPFMIDSNIATWTKAYFNKRAEFSQNSINERSFEKVYDCSGVGCMTYYFTSINGKVYGVATFAQGEGKMVYENEVAYILKSLQFNKVTKKTITKEEAIAKVKEQPEVITYLKRVPGGHVLVNGEEDDVYLVQVYEIKGGHTATFNWYTVDKITGETKITAQ